MNKSTCAINYNNPTLIDNYRNKANIKNTQCSILSKNNNGIIDCLDANEERIVFNKFNCGDTDKLTCYQNKLKEYDCNTALCLLNKKYLQTEDDNILKIIADKYKPPQPVSWSRCNAKNKHKCHYTWLTNIDIHNVLSQYDKKIKNYKFLGIFMIDFIQVPRNLLGEHINLLDINFYNYQKIGINHLGSVFNTDTSKGRGIHWVGMFIFWDMKSMRAEINYFDSAGSQHQIPNTILVLMKTLKSNNKQFDITCHINKMDHQSSTSECGVYSIFFNIFSLYNKYSDLNQSRIDDNTIHMFRDILFNKIN